MSDFGLEIGGQVDNIDGTERTLLWANTATDTKHFRNEGNFGGWFDLNAEFA